MTIYHSDTTRVSQPLGLNAQTMKESRGKINLSGLPVSGHDCQRLTNVADHIMAEYGRVRKTKEYPCEEKEMKATVRNNPFTTPQVNEKLSGGGGDISHNLSALDLANPVSAGTIIRSARLTRADDNTIEKYLRVFSTYPHSEHHESLAANVTVINHDDTSLALRIWPADAKGEQYPRTVLIINDQRYADSALAFMGDFGALDVLLCHRESASAGRYTIADKSTLCQLTAAQLAKISLYLSEGQRLNLDTLFNKYHIEVESSQPEGNISDKERIHRQTLTDFMRIAKIAPNGAALLSFRGDHDDIKILHQTSASGYQKMVESNQINVSKAGCMGAAVYGTVVLPQDYAGGHTIAMAKRGEIADNVRKYPEKTVSEVITLTRENARQDNDLTTLTKNKQSGYLLFDVDNRNSNNLTNWIERFGNGTTYLEAAFRMEHDLNTGNKRFLSSSRRERGIIEGVKRKCFDDYGVLYQFLDFAHRTQLQLIRQERCDDTITLFNKLWGFFVSARDNAPVLLNNVLFEAVKDFILLYSQGEQTKKRVASKSFDMDLQYSIIFELFPDMLTNWDTVKFRPDWEHLVATLKNYDTGFNEDTFKTFLLNALHFYVNHRLLDGDPPVNPLRLADFSDLASAHPNLAGMLYHCIGAGDYKGQAFFEQHLSYVNRCEDEALKVTKNTLTIKAGLFGTEEYGIRHNAEVSVSETIFRQNDEHATVSAGENLDIILRREVTGHSGFTQRAVKPA